ncbi:MAG: hypothetical protein ABMB14_15045 [Myxococcota bacterium]
MTIGLGWVVMAAGAQQITVLEDRGAAIDPNGTTRWSFEATRAVGIHRVLGASTTTGWGVSAYGETTERLCEAPCVLEVPNGVYRLRIGDSFLFGDRVDLTATGGSAAWEVRDARPAAGVAGIVLTGAGLGTVLSGLLLTGFGEPGDPTGPVTTVAAVPITAGGIGLLVGAFAHARPIAR